MVLSEIEGNSACNIPTKMSSQTKAKPQAAAANTPGPWTIDSTYRAEMPWCAFSILAPDTIEASEDSGAHYGVAYVQQTMGEQAEANARLIAAAPRLLEALRGLFDGQGCERVYEYGAAVIHKEWMARCRAAIAQAEGRAS